MGRQKLPELNPVCGERLKALCKAEGISQEELAEIIETSSQTISKAAKGKRLTLNIANKIIDAFPKYNISWLLGYSPHMYKSDEEAAAQQWKECFDEAVIRRRAELTITLASLYDFAGFPTEYNSEGMTVTDRSGREVTLSLDELKELEDDIFAFLRYRLNKLMEKGR